MDRLRQYKMGLMYIVRYLALCMTMRVNLNRIA